MREATQGLGLLFIVDLDRTLRLVKFHCRKARSLLTSTGQSQQEGNLHISIPQDTFHILGVSSSRLYTNFLQLGLHMDFPSTL